MEKLGLRNHLKPNIGSEHTVNHDSFSPSPTIGNFLIKELPRRTILPVFINIIHPGKSGFLCFGLKKSGLKRCFVAEVKWTTDVCVVAILQFPINNPMPDLMQVLSNLSCHDTHILS